ncbi:MAG: HNH endonuclease [Nocardioides sp.]
MTASPLEIAPGVHPVFEHGDTDRLDGMLTELAAIEGDPGAAGPMADVHRIDQIQRLEQIKASAAAAQARITVEFERSQLARQDDAGVRRNERGRGIGDQVALARGCPASQGSRHLGFAKAMAEMPHTLAILSDGRVDEWTATCLVRETAILSLEDRKLVDERLCAMTIHTRTGEVREPPVLGWTPKRVTGAARALAAEIDPESAVRRAARAAGDRRVTIRPAPDTMAYITTLLPVAQGVACWASLTGAAKAKKAAGDGRTESQIMADLFVQRLTGQSAVGAVPVEIQLVMTPDTLIGTSERPARIGDCVVPAQTARDLAERPDAPRWLRRIFTDPITGVATSLDPRRRRFGPQDDRFLDVRDQTCRHPRCDGAIADHDHVVRAADHGETTRDNGQGLCEAHNLVKEAPGWTARVIDPNPGRHTVEVTTPTGHTYRSNAPPALPPPVSRPTRHPSG